MSETTQQTEHPSHMRRVSVENETWINRYSRGKPVRIVDRLQVARMLDKTRALAIQKRGGSGMGAGAFVEVMWGNDDDAGTQQLDSPDDPVLGDLPLGGVWHARRFATAHERTTEWDGNNHVAMHAEHTRSVIASA